MRVLLISLLILAGCGEAPPKPTGPPVTEADIVGKWRGARPPMGKKAIYIYDIKPDGDLVLTTAIEKLIPQAATGSWQLDNNRIMILAAGQFDQGWIDVRVEKNTLILADRYRFSRVK